MTCIVTKLERQIYCDIMIESYLEWKCQSQELSSPILCNWYNLVLWCIEKMQSCVCRALHMGKCAKTMKMFWRNAVPKYAKVTSNSHLKHWLPYFKVKQEFFKKSTCILCMLVSVEQLLNKMLFKPKSFYNVLGGFEFAIMATETDKIRFTYPTISPTVNVIPTKYMQHDNQLLPL